MHRHVSGGLVFFFILNVSAVNLKGLTNVSSCPSESTTWIQRESLKSCDEGEGFLYHCMKSSWGTFVEFCMVPVSINVYDGCPQIHGSDNLHITYVKCSMSGKCPNKYNDTYVSYQMYKYDGCYKEDTNATHITIERTSATKYSSKSSATISPYTNVDFTSSNNDNQGATGGILAGMLVLVLCGSLTFSVSYIRKTRKYRKNEYFVKYHANSDVNRREEGVYNEIEEVQREVSDNRSYEEPVSVTIVQSEIVLTA